MENKNNRKELTEEEKKLRAKYYRNWHKNHPGKAREYAIAYWKRRVAKELENMQKDG